MQLVHLAGADLNQTPLDWDNNKRNIINSIEQAKKQQVSILCLPELCITGYGCEDAFHSVSIINTSQKVLKEILPYTKDIIVSLGLPYLHNNRIYNTACLVVNTRIVGFVPKKFLASEGIHYESRWFKPWPEGETSSVTIDGEVVPFGDICFDCSGVRLGFEICEDAWVANRPGRTLAMKGIDIILNPSASHFAFGKYEVRKRFILEGSRSFGVSYVYSNLLGNEAGRAIYDGGTVIASSGKMLKVAKRFTFVDFQVTSAVIDIDLTRMHQSKSSNFEEYNKLHDNNYILCDYIFPDISPNGGGGNVEDWETSVYIKEEEFTRAITLGLFDYMRKSRSNSFIVSLSGGADSASVAVLVALSFSFGINELGKEDFLKKLQYIKGLDPSVSLKHIINQCLVCVYQATKNSSDTTFNAARIIAETLGARFYRFDVDGMVEGYTNMVSQAIGREITWEHDDLALQNIQARSRTPGIWLLTNIFNGLLLATSNRSEAAVGYATMDGDTCGGLSPIAGIDKAFILQWLSWIEKHGPAGIGPISELHVITAQKPTAELRPVEQKQTDEDDLMPYTILDEIERYAIRDKKVPEEVLVLLRSSHPERSVRQLKEWIEKFFTLWCRNQWKRERYAPSFHVDDANLDPKTWCRFPILSGGFRRELKDLHDAVDK